MNHEAVYRTAPATPGLLNTTQWISSLKLRTSHDHQKYEKAIRPDINHLTKKRASPELGEH